MKIYILADFEGTSGAVRPEQVIPGNPEYERIRLLWMKELNAAIKGALAGGATEVVIGEGHWTNINILPEKLHPAATYYSGLFKNNMQLGGLDSSFKGLFMFCHSKAGTADGILSHTWAPRQICDIRLNGVSVGEIGLNAALAGSIGIPVGLIVGDLAATREAEELMPIINKVVTKAGVDRYCGYCRNPKMVRYEIENAAKQCVQELKTRKPFILATPYTVEMDFSGETMALVCSMIPGVERIGSRRIRFSNNNMSECYHLTFICSIIAQNPGCIDNVFN